MKKRYFFLCLLAAVLMLGACQLETSGNGKFDGYWRLERIDTLGGGVNRMEGQRIFWAFQSRLNGRVQACLLRFRKEKDSLLLSDPYLYNRESGDEPITQLARLAPFGLNSLDERFKVERLGGEKMVLANKKYRLYFTRF